MDKFNFLKRGHSLLVSLLIALMVLAPALYFNALSDDVFDEPREYLIVLLGGMAVLLVEARRVARGHALLSGGSGTWPRRLLLLFLGWAALSAAMAVNSSVGWAYFVTVAAFVLIGISLLGWLEESSRRRTVALGVLAALVGTQVVVAAAQFLKLQLFAWSKQMPAVMFGGQVVPGGFWPYDLLVGLGVQGGDGRLLGTLGNVNYLGELLCLTIPVLVGWAAASRNRLVRWGVGLLVAVAFGVLAYNSARGALLGLIVAAPIAAVSVWGNARFHPKRHWQSPRSRLVIGLGLIVGLSLATFAGVRVVQKSVAGGQVDMAVQARLVNWRSDLGLVVSRPIAGVGVGNYKVVNQDKLRADNPSGIAAVAKDGRFLRAHNEPLQALIEFGLVGFLMLGALLIIWWRAVQHNDEVRPVLRFGILWGVGALLIAGCFGFPLHVPVTAIAFVLVLAAGLARSREHGRPPLLGNWWRMGYATVAIGLLVGVVFLTVQKVFLPQYLVHEHLFAARSLYINNREPQALVSYEVVDRMARFRGIYRIEYIRSLVETERYDEAIRLLNASDREGLGTQAIYWRARALSGLGRLEEARSAYDEVIAYFSPDSRWGAAAVTDLEAIMRGDRPSRERR